MTKINGPTASDAIETLTNLTKSAFDGHGQGHHRIIHFTWLDNFFFVALLGVSVLIGLYYGFWSKHKQNNRSEYILGGRTMQIVPIAASLVASHISGHTLLGTPVEVYSNGTQYIIFIVTGIVLGLALIYVYVPLFFRLGMTSSFEYLERRFGRTVRILASRLFVLKAICYTPLIVYVPALALSQVTGCKLHVVSPIMCAVCVFYTTIGGLRAVVWTDFIQFILIVAAITIPFWLQ